MFLMLANVNQMSYLGYHLSNYILILYGRIGTALLFSENKIIHDVAGVGSVMNILVLK